MINITLANNEIYEWDYYKAPHILIEGETRSGKSVVLKSIENDIREQGFRVEFRPMEHFDPLFENTDFIIDKYKEIAEREGRLFLIIDDIQNYYRCEKRCKQKIANFLQIARVFNINIIITSQRPSKEILNNCAIRLKAVEDFEWILIDDVKERIVKFNY